MVSCFGFFDYDFALRTYLQHPASPATITIAFTLKAFIQVNMNVSVSG